MACFGGGQSEIVPIMEEEDEPGAPMTPGGSRDSEAGDSRSEAPTDDTGDSPHAPPVFLPAPPEVRVRPPLQASAAAAAVAAAARARAQPLGAAAAAAQAQPRFCMPATLQDFWRELGAAFDPRRRRCF
jgi:hypothetical protein